MANIFDPKIYFDLGNFIVRSTWEQVSGGDEARSNFVTRQNMKAKIYFALIELWNQIDKEIRRQDPTGVHFEEDSELGKAFDAFRQEAENVYSDFEVDTKYDQMGAIEGFLERAGTFYHTRIIAGNDSTRKSISKEFEKFWNQYFKLVKSEYETIDHQSIEADFMDELVTGALSESIKGARSKTFDSASTKKQDETKKHLEGRLLIDLEASYEKRQSLIISPEESHDFATRARDAILPDMLTFFGNTLSRDLDGYHLIKIARDFKRLLLTGQNAALAMLVGHGIRYCKAFSMIYSSHKSVQKALKSDPEVAELLDSYDLDLMQFLRSRGYFDTNDPRAADFEKLLVFPKKNEKKIKIYFRAAIVLWTIPAFQNFFTRQDEDTLVELAVQALETKFEQLRHTLIPRDAVLDQYLHQELRRLSNRYNWLTESIAHLLTHMNLDELHVKELVEAEWGQHIEDDDPHNLELIIGAADLLTHNIALQTIWDIRDKIGNSIKHRIANELTNEFVRDLKDNHVTAARNISKDVINLVRYRLLILGEENEKKLADEIYQVGFIENEEERFAKLKKIEDEIDMIISDEQREYANKLGAQLMADFREYLEDAIKVQMANEYEHFRTSGEFDFFVDYDSETLYGVLAEFFRNVKDALDRHNHYMN